MNVIIENIGWTMVIIGLIAVLLIWCNGKDVG